ncbi:amidohydrolase family protein [Mesoterricola silvestris]|uniref:Dihydropyrimidinase n=1 Tax=Mesoterricola silvestris TaxID=2927979 RepID=A0AA48KC31_9BACT|nr:amidohydrolase family protein [Mesoterricola silvestris]BDU74932.1 dihydropyrimidinase [Mesoterricola silvestris]
MKIAIRNGRVAQGDRLVKADVLVEDGLIRAVGHAGPADRDLDASGCYVLPGFMDFHTHVDDHIGRFYLADNYETATREAMLNGITTLCTFVTQAEGQTLRQAMAAARAKALDTCHGDVLWHLTPTTFEPGDLRFLEALLEAGYRTLKFYTTYRPAGLYVSYQSLGDLFQRLSPLGATFMVHCEDDDIIAHVEPGALDLSKAVSHTRLRSEEAEVEAIRRVTELALAKGASLHVVHVSTLEGARAIVAAKAEGDVSMETCPQYLYLDETFLQRPDGHHWLCSPPLRGHREAFRALAREGAFDMVATDHCAFRPEDKDSWNGQDLRQVPNGMPGLGALPHVTWKIWEDDPDRSALGLATHLALNPALRAGVADRKGAILPGLDADIVVLDPHGPERPVRSTGVPTFEPFPGFTTKLHFRSVLLRGVPRVQDGRLLEPDRPMGVPLQPDPETLPFT